MNNDQQPVAYDAEGRPLYAHPPAEPVTPPVQPQPQQPTPPAPVVQVMRPISPEKAIVSAEDQKRHEESKEAYPTLNLSAGEHVINAVRRHPIGLVLPLGLGTVLIGLALGVLVNYNALVGSMNLIGLPVDVSTVAIPILLLCIAVGLGMFISWYVYVSNKFFLTNESVIQEIQYSLFSRLEQTVSLASIEDASFTQNGILQHLFDYGDIRLSTEGDETTYRFSYVANPRGHIDELNNAVEAFKNGRPVTND
jgi:hypothetical protein